MQNNFRKEPPYMLSLLNIYVQIIRFFEIDNFTRSRAKHIPIEHITKCERMADGVYLVPTIKVI